MNCISSLLNQKIWTIKDIIVWSSQYLEKHSASTSSRLDVELLLAHVLGCTRIDLYMMLDKPLVEEERQKFKELLLKRVSKMPVAYILQKKYFWEYEFYVNSAVMIPRAETETLVERCLDYIKSCYDSDMIINILDVGTGSGCVGISIVKSLPNVKAVCVDIDSRALEVASKNSKNLQVADKISFKLMDALNYNEWENLNFKFDIVISNPPYISFNTKHYLSEEVIKYEPHVALFTDDNGYRFYKAFAKYAPLVLKKRGCIMLEFGVDQDIKILRSIFEKQNIWDISTLNFYKDLYKKYRVLKINMK